MRDLRLYRQTVFENWGDLPLDENCPNCYYIDITSITIEETKDGDNV